MKTIITYEFSTLYCENEIKTEEEKNIKTIDEDAYNDLCKMIVSNKDFRQAMSFRTGNKREGIKINGFVGTLQTRNGQSIEILPKIYKFSDGTENSLRTCRLIFLNMLRYYTDFPSLTNNDAELDRLDKFPILEIFINRFVTEVEDLIQSGLQKNYIDITEETSFLKGKILIHEQLKRSSLLKGKFITVHDDYNINIPENRLIITTLNKLHEESKDSSNKTRISMLLNFLSGIPRSTNIEEDIAKCSNQNRLFAKYENIITWSKIFLRNGSLSTFSGKYLNHCILFQTWRLFESFMSALVKKSIRAYIVKPQDRTTYLVSKHDNKPFYNLRPDLFLLDKDVKRKHNIIIDFKWKNVDSKNKNNYYGIADRDWLQLYAYGIKYSLFFQSPVSLAIIAPLSNAFQELLSPFIFEETIDNKNITLKIIPFDLSSPKNYTSQIINIISQL